MKCFYTITSYPTYFLTSYCNSQYISKKCNIFLGYKGVIFGYQIGTILCWSSDLICNSPQRTAMDLHLNVNPRGSIDNSTRSLIFGRLLTSLTKSTWIILPSFLEQIHTKINRNLNTSIQELTENTKLDTLWLSQVNSSNTSPNLTNGPLA